MKKRTAKIHTEKHEHAEGSYRSYTLGFLFSIIATIIPFLLLMYHLASGSAFVAIAVAAALIQLLVQLVLFLHLKFNKKSSTNLVILVYTLVLVGAIVVGTLWIMRNLSTNMTQNVYPQGDVTPQTEAY